MSTSQPDSVPHTVGPIGYGDALALDPDTVPGRTPVAVATQSWSAQAAATLPEDVRDTIQVKFMARVETGSMAGLCYVLDTPGTVNVSDIKAVHTVGDDGDRALVAFDKLGFRMVDGVHYVCKQEEERNAAMAYPLSQEQYDLEFIQHCRKVNRHNKRKRGADADADGDDSSDYDPAEGNAIYGSGGDGGGDDSSDSDYDDGDFEEDSDDTSLDGFIVHSSDEEQHEDNGEQETDTAFTHPKADCDNADVKAMRSAASDYRKWQPRTDQERAAKALIDRIEARARHAEDEKRFRRGEAALEADR